LEGVPNWELRREVFSQIRIRRQKKKRAFKNLSRIRGRLYLVVTGWLEREG